MDVVLLLVFFIVAIATLWLVEPSLYLSPLRNALGKPTFKKGLYPHIEYEFPEHLILTEYRLEIKKELISLLLDGKSFPIKAMKVSPKGKKADSRHQFILMTGGRWLEENCKLCPFTSSMIHDIPGVVSAQFSVLSPGMELELQPGKGKDRLCYHLPLIVPRLGHCKYQVGDSIGNWRSGEAILFHDSNSYCASNLSDEFRILLCLQIERPRSTATVENPLPSKALLNLSEILPGESKNPSFF